jgi:hypothetical protein
VIEALIQATMSSRWTNSRTCRENPSAARRRAAGSGEPTHIDATTANDRAVSASAPSAPARTAKDAASKPHDAAILRELVVVSHSFVLSRRRT